MDLYVVERAVRFSKLIGVVAVAIDVSQGGGESAVGEEEHQGVYTLLIVDMKIPKHVCRRHVGGRVRLVGTIEGGELDRVSDEEDGLVVEYPVLVALGGLELNSPSADVADGVGGTSCWAYCRYASEKLCAFANTSE